jgi:hypothetical protein
MLRPTMPPRVVQLRDRRREIQLQPRREDDDGGLKALDRGDQPARVFALRDDAHVVFEREHARRSRAEDNLVVGQYDSVHWDSGSSLGHDSSAVPSSAPGPAPARVYPIRTASEVL